MSVTRRQVLRGMAAAGGLALAPGILAACGDSSGSTTTAGGSATTAGAAVSTGTVTIGSNYSDQVPRDAFASLIKAFNDQGGAEVTINTVDHNTFQEQINTYLQGTPDDVFTWFAGYRMQFFAAQGLATDISDVWTEIGGNFSDAFKGASTGLDGKQYFVPLYLYPWAVFYRKSMFEDNGWSMPTTWDDYKTLLQAMKDNGTPLAFADKDGWPAMGTFDYINMRTNGYQYHVDLMAGRESWEDDRTKQVFANWAEILPLVQEGSLGRTWQEGAQSLVKKEAGGYVLGMFVSQQFTEQADLDDLDFFAFPEIDPANGQDSVEAPIDGFMASKAPQNLDGAKALLAYLGSPSAEELYIASDPGNVAASKDADTSGYNALQNKAVELIGAADHISQFLDRDTRPDFASTVALPSFQTFIDNPADIDGLAKSMEEQKKAIFES